MNFGDERLPKRFWDKCVPEPNTGCWLWFACISTGYGKLGPKATIEGEQLAHRAAYRALRGPIPDGLCIDHLCRTRSCVNPAHMEIVTRGENVRRGDGWKTNGLKTHCKNGHEFTPENTYLKVRHIQRRMVSARPSIGRQCVTCAKRRAREREARIRAVRTRAA